MPTRASKAKGKEPAEKRGRKDSTNARGSVSASTDSDHHEGSLVQVGPGVVHGAGSCGDAVSSEVRSELRFNHQKTLHTQLKQRFSYEPWFCNY